MLPSLSSLDNSFFIAIAAFLACIGSDGTPVTFTFNSLTEKNLYKIIDLQLNDLRYNLSKKNMKLQVNPTAKKVLLQNGSHREWGARPIRRIIQNDIENIISYKYLSGELKENSKIIVNGKGDRLIFDNVDLPTKKSNNKPASKKKSKKTIK